MLTQSRSTIATAAPESSTKGGVLVCQIQYMLRQAGTLNDAPNLDRTLFLDKLTNGEKQRRRELQHISA